MRRTLRQLAAVKPARYLEPYAPTGLTGLLTHPAPRSTLIYVYSSTLDKLKQFPETSLYRQSAEALTKHRLKIVQDVVPEGYEAWSEKASKLMKEHPEVFTTPKGGVSHDGETHVMQIKDEKVFVRTKIEPEVDWSREEWDGEVGAPELEGVRTTAERKDQKVLGLERPGEDEKQIVWEAEPALTADQISEIENKIGAGLIEEVIQVAEGELKLTDVLLKAKVWEDLEDKPVEGQWSYFTRDAGPSSS
ncbi:hypothetical protein CJF30_00004251 [Rutstroemia sp. NJR-2017a BBW]|nr:hypothetical protein CJF30_00004251 [Rutstroemia sp. NJR-2017a BBW]